MEIDAMKTKQTRTHAAAKTAGTRRERPPKPRRFKVPPPGTAYIPTSAAEERATRAYRTATLVRALDALYDAPDDAKGDLVVEPLRFRPPPP